MTTILNCAQKQASNQYSVCTCTHSYINIKPAQSFPLSLCAPFTVRNDLISLSSSPQLATGRRSHLTSLIYVDNCALLTTVHLAV